MTTLFLLLSFCFAWSSYNLYHPVYHHPRLSMLSFMFGWLTGELAIHHMVAQMLIVLTLVYLGAVEGFAGSVGLLLSLLAWIGLGNFYFRSTAAQQQMNDALAHGLGIDYLKQVDPDLSAHFPDEPDFEKIKKPVNNIDPRVEVIKNVAFGNHGQKLDIYRPRRELSNSPVLLQIHGGAWTEKMGSKNEQALPLMSHMALRDWICVSIDYRLSPGATWPAHIIDCKEALVWVKRHITQYGGNPDFIIVTGGSAGGHLCSLVALSPNDPAFQPGFENEDTQVQGAVSFYGVYDLTDEHKLQKNAGQRKLMETSVLKMALEGNLDTYQAASPLFRVSSEAPPFLIIHGDKDTLVPVEVAREFTRALTAVSKNAVVYAEIKDAQHAFDMFPSVRSEHVKHGVEKFLAWRYSQYRHAKQAIESPGQPTQELYD